MRRNSPTMSAAGIGSRSGKCSSASSVSSGARSSADTSSRSRGPRATPRRTRVSRAASSGTSRALHSNEGSSCNGNGSGTRDGGGACAGSAGAPGGDHRADPRLQRVGKPEAALGETHGGPRGAREDVRDPGRRRREHGSDPGPPPRAAPLGSASPRDRLPAELRQVGRALGRLRSRAGTRDRHDGRRSARRFRGDRPSDPEARRGLRPRFGVEAESPGPDHEDGPLQALQRGDLVDDRGPAPRHELRPQSLSRGGREDDPPSRGAPSVHSGARALERIPRGRDAHGAPPPAPRKDQVRRGPVPERLSRSSRGHVPHHELEAPPPPLREARRLLRARRRRDHDRILVALGARRRVEAPPGASLRRGAGSPRHPVHLDGIPGRAHRQHALARAGLRHPGAALGAPFQRLRGALKAAILGPTYPHRGGIAHYTTLLARALAKRHRLAIVSFRRLYPGLLFPGTTQFDSSREAIEPPVPPEPILDSVNPFSWVRAGARIRAIAPDFLVVPWWHPFFGPSLGTASRGARGKDGGERGRRPARIFLCHNVAPHEATPLDRALTTYGLGAADAFLVHAHAEAKKLEPLAQGRALRGRVRVVNRYVPNEEVAPYFAAADVVALPYREATGSGIAQVAFGAGVPVIATRTGGLEEVIEEGVSGLLVPPRDPPALARAIERFFDENLGARLREGVARTRGRFEWEGLVQAIESLAEEVPR